MDDERALDAELDQRSRHRLSERRARHSEQVAAHARRIRERAEDVEHGADPDLAAHRSGVAHRGVVSRREHEPDPRLVHARGDACRAKVDLHAERLEHVGAAALTRRRAVPVLRHVTARARDDDRADGRDVDAVRPIAPRADDVDRAVVNDDAKRVRTERTREARDLVGRLAAHVQRREQRAELRWRRLAGHDRAHRGFGLRPSERFAGRDDRERLTRVQGSSPTCASRPS